MNKTIEAVGYMIDNLGIGPDEVFKLIESSEGYTGEDYNRWLAGQVIEIAQSEGVQRSDILVHKLRILVALSKMTGSGITEVLKGYLSGTLGVSEELLDGNSVGLVDYSKFVDLEKGYFNPDFMLVRLSSSPSKDRSLVAEAKKLGTTISTEGGAMLYRMTFGSHDVERLVLLSDDTFFRDNKDVMFEFGNYYEFVEGAYLLKSKAFVGDFSDGNLLVTVWTRRGIPNEAVSTGWNKELQAPFSSEDGFAVALPAVGNEATANPFDLSIFYSHGKFYNLDTLVNFYRGVDEAIDGDNMYLNINGKTTIDLSQRDSAFSTYVFSDGDLLERLIVHYGVTASVDGAWGFGNGAEVILDGMPGYKTLIANCLPVFLFDTDSNLVDGLTWNGEVTRKLYDKYESFMSFESKELFSLVNSYCTSVCAGGGFDGATFNSIRLETNNERFNEMYTSSLSRAKGYIKQQVGDFLC